MGRITALFVGIVAMTIVSTVAEARDGCGRGFYYNGRRCVPQSDYDRGYYDRDYYDRGYRYRREPGVSVDVGPNLRLNSVTVLDRIPAGTVNVKPATVAIAVRTVL